MMSPYHWKRAILVAVLLVVVTLAGCTDSGSNDLIPGDTSTEDSESKNAQNGPASEPEPTPDAGSVHGQVVDDAYEPINGALIAISNNTGTFAESIADEQGKYTINDIPPGKYGIRFTAECCQEHLDQIRVNADRTTTSSPVLIAWGGHEPYTQENKWTGYICAEGPPFIDQCKSADEEHNTQYDFEVDRGIKTLVVGMHFENGFNLEECLALTLSVPAFTHDDYGSGTLRSTDCEESPIEFRMDAGTMRGTHDRPIEEHDFENITDWMPLHYRIDGDRWSYSPLSDPIPELHNVVFAQTFTIHWKEFYWEHAPEGASALPDQ